MISAIAETLAKPFVELERRHPTTIGYVWGIIGTLCLSTSNFFVKRVSKDVPAIEIYFFRSAQILMYTYALMTLQNMQFHYKISSINRLLLLRGFLGAFAMGTTYYSVRILPLSDATVMLQVHPVITGILASLVLKEKYELTQLGSALVCLVGVVFIAQPPILFGDIATKGIDSNARVLGTTLLVMSGFMSSGVEVLVRKIGLKTNVGVVTFIFALESSMISALACMFNRFVALNWHDIVQVLFCGFFSFGHQVMRARAFILVSAGRMTNIGYFGMLNAYVLDIFVVGTEISLYSAIGAMFIFSSLFFYLYQMYLKRD